MIIIFIDKLSTTTSFLDLFYHAVIFAFNICHYIEKHFRRRNVPINEHVIICTKLVAYNLN